MKTLFQNPVKILSLLNASPELQAVLAREKRNDIEAEKQARIDCLARMKASEAAQIGKNKVLEIALAALQEAEKRVAELRPAVANAHNALAEEQRAYANAANELLRQHGGGVISQTLYRLDRLINNTTDEISRLELLKNPHVVVDGQITFRPVPPDIAQRQKVRAQRVEAYQKLYVKANEFTEAELAPSEIHDLCGAICSAIGQPLTPSEVTE